MGSWRITAPPRRSCVSAAGTSECWAARSSGAGAPWDSHTPQLGLLAVPNSCHPTQGPAELEDEAATVPGQETEGAGKGVGYQVGSESRAVPRLGWGCAQHSFSELLPFGSLSSDEEEEGREEEKKEKMEAKAAAAEEAKEQEEVELALAEMKAKELAELKR